MGRVRKLSVRSEYCLTLNGLDTAQGPSRFQQNRARRLVPAGHTNARYMMSPRHLTQLRIDLGTLFNRERTARPEATTRRRVDRRRNVPLQPDSLSLLFRIRNRNGGQQGLRIRVQRL